MATFVSYARQDRELVGGLKVDLERLGREVWIDEKLRGGQEWWDEILAAIRSCDVFVWTVSPASVKSTACKAELTYASDLGRPVLPIMIKPVAIGLTPQRVANAQIVDYTTRGADQAIKLAGDLQAIQLPPPLPATLPAPPPVPISYLEQFLQQVTTPTPMSIADQRAFLDYLRPLATSTEDPDETEAVCDLLRRLRVRPEVTFEAAAAIDKILENPPDPHPPQSRRKIETTEFQSPVQPSQWEQAPPPPPQQGFPSPPQPAVVTPPPTPGSAVPPDPSPIAARDHITGPSPSVLRGVRCSRGHFNDPAAVYCATCGVVLVLQTHELVSSDETGWLCPRGHFNPMSGGPACVVCGTLMAMPVLDHDVQFTVYRPRAMRPRTWEQLLVFVHRTEFAEGELDPVEEVRRQADQVLGPDASRFRSTSQDAGLSLPRGDELSLVPQVDGLEFNPPQRSFRWLREVHREEFGFITDLPDGTNAHGRLCVYLGSVLIAEVALSIPVSAVAAGSQPGGPQAIEHARRYRRIFASYSHDDAEVVERVHTYAAVTGDEFMRDVTHLRVGQDWNEALRDLIRKADLFQLFWSWSSMRSPEVRKEYEYALSLKRSEFIRPVYWQDPFPEAPTEDLPPGDLRAIQFSVLPGRHRATEFQSPVQPSQWAPSPPPPPLVFSSPSPPPPPQGLQPEVRPPAPAGSGTAWSRGVVVLLLLATVFSAGVVGIVAGLIGRSNPAKRSQANFILWLGVGVLALWILVVAMGGATDSCDPSVEFC